MYKWISVFLIVLSSLGCGSGSDGDSENAQREAEREGQEQKNILNELAGKWERGCTISQMDALSQMLFGHGYNKTEITVTGDSLNVSFTSYLNSDCTFPDGLGGRTIQPIEYVGDTSLPDGSVGSVISLPLQDRLTFHYLIRVDGDVLYIQDDGKNDTLNYDSPFYRVQ